MEWLLYVSVAVIAIAFLILVFYVVQMLKSVKTTLDHVATTIESLETQLNGITSETTELLHRTNRLAEDIQDKSLALNSVVDRVKDVGDSFGTLNESIQNINHRVVQGTERYSDQVEKAVEWSSAALRVWHKWKMQQREQVDDYVEQKD